MIFKVPSSPNHPVIPSCPSSWLGSTQKCLPGSLCRGTKKALQRNMHPIAPGVWVKPLTASPRDGITPKIMLPAYRQKESALLR